MHRGRAAVRRRRGLDEHVTLIVAALYEDPVDEGRWFFGAGDLPRWLGYRLGHCLVSERIAALGSNAVALVDEPAETFIGSGAR